MTEGEGGVCEPLLPAPAWLAGRGGRPASRCMRDIVDAIRYLTHNGPVWRALPARLPPPPALYRGGGQGQAKRAAGGGRGGPRAPGPAPARAEAGPPAAA